MGEEILFRREYTVRRLEEITGTYSGFRVDVVPADAGENSLAKDSTFFLFADPHAVALRPGMKIELLAREEE